ncbi:MAG: T9SS type A sorting domain-containing protein [bacterium]|nr:T9SS type A sorting domain-containing protein [bacterium]
MKLSKSSIAVLSFVLLGAGLISASYSSKKMSNKTAPPRSGGLASVQFQDRTGSPISSGTCGNCHSGGTFGTSVTIEVKDAGNNVITSYTPGTTYTVEYTINTTSGTPSGYGMQSVILNSSNGGAGTYGTVNTANSQISPLNGVDYFEQQGAQAAGFFSVDWTAPNAGTGDVSIYSVGVAINGNGNTSGDQASSSTSIILSEDIPTSIDFPGNPYCADATNPTPAVSGEQGGTFSAPVGLDINPTSGQINIASSTAGTYTVTYTGSTSSATFDVTIYPTYSTTDAASICSNDSYQFGSQTLTAANAGLNTEVFQSVNGCDSTVELTLTVLPSPTTQISETICAGETFDFNGQTLDASNAGLNTATLSSVNGCDSVVELTLNVTQIDPTLSIGVGELTANQNNASYQWIDCDNNTILTGETNQLFTTTIAGNYAAIITLDGCVDTTDCEAPIFSGISENYSSVLQVYPSPATTILKVDNLNDLVDVNKMEIVIISGQTLWSSSTAIDEISASALPSGTYFLKVRHAKGEEVVKFVKR